MMERLVSNQSFALNISDSNPVIVSTPPALKQIHDILIVVLLVTVMFAMGCSITWIQVCFMLQKSILSTISLSFPASIFTLSSSDEH